MSLSHPEVLAHIALTSELLEQIIREEKEDPEEIPHIRKLMVEGRGPHFSIDEQGVVRHKDRLVVPSNEWLRRWWLACCKVTAVVHGVLRRVRSG